MYRTIYSLAGLVGVLLLGSTTYVVGAITGKVSLTLPLFFWMLAALVIANVWLLLTVWRVWARIPTLVQVGFIIWGGVATWYWTFGALYFVLSLNLDARQLAWTAFDFLWEVPVIGGGMLTTLGVLLFRPIVRAVEEGESQKDPLAGYRRAVRYPGRISALLFFFSVFGYLVGSWQLGQFAGMSHFELVKSISNGPIVAVFLAVFFYVTFDTYVDDYRRRLSRWVIDRPSQVRSLRRRLGLVNIAAVIGGIGLLGLLVVQSWQGLQEERLEAELSRDISVLKTADLQDRHGLDVLARGAGGQVKLVSLSALDNFEAAEETRTILRESSEGVVRDLYKRGKMIAFAERDGGDRLISIVYLADFYGFARPDGWVRYGFGAVIVTSMTAALFLYVSYEITRSLVSLRSFAEKPSVARWGKLVNVHTGDEIESIGRTFLRYVQKVEEEDKTKREFVSIASHQLRTPLTSIQWYIELLMQERGGKLNEQQLHDLERIDRGSKRMVQLVNDLLNVSRIDSGRLAIRPQETELARFVQELVNEVVPQAQNVECRLEIENGLDGARVWVDQLLLRQVVHNLLINAVKYRDLEQKCSVLVRLGRQKSGDFVLTVRDNGIGIPEEEQHRVFEKFWRAENVTTLNTEGTGLGLYVSKMLIEAAGGRLSFTSKAGAGTTFQVVIPAKGMRSKPGEVGLTGIREVE